MTRTRWMTIAAGLAAGVMVGLAGAGPDHGEHEHKEHEHKNHEHADAGENLFEVISVENGDKYEVIVHGEETTARVNGLKIAQDRLLKKDGYIVILDDDGDVLKKLAVRPGGQQNSFFSSKNNRVVRGQNSQFPGAMTFDWTSDRENEFQRAVEMERPPVMLGVLLETPGEALQAQLGISEHAIVLEKVLEGLPADEAGLKRWDIIIEIDGDEVDEPGMLGGVLMESEPGDELELLVMRGGKEIERTLELAAYDAEMLGTTTIEITSDAAEGEGGALRFGWNTQGNEFTKRSIEEAVREIEKLGVFGGDEETQQKFRLQLERMQRQLGAQTDQLRQSRNLLLDNQGRLIIDDEERAEMALHLEQRLEDLEHQFEDRLESLEETLEERWERMEEVFDRMFDRFEMMLDKARSDRD